MINKVNIKLIAHNCRISRDIKILVFAIFLLFAAGECYSQNKTSVITGRVMLEDREPGALSTVILLAADSSILTSTACDDKGTYQFTVQEGVYLLLASRIGYNQSFSGPYNTATSRDITAGDIVLVKSIPELKEVSVTARKPYVDVKPGRMVLNVQNSIIAEGNSVYDLLRQAPGVHAGGQGSISLIGRQNALILVDGKPTNLNGENLAAMLQGMQSSTVQQIELITNPSARYEAGGAGVINIILKKGSNAGTNGTITVGGGYGKFYKSNAGIVFNNRMGNVNIFGNYNFAANKTFHTFTTDRTIAYNGLTSNYDSRYYTTQESLNQAFRLGSDFILSKDHSLGLLVGGTFNNSDYVKDNSLRISNSGRFDSTIVTMANLKRNLTNMNYNLNYSGKLDTMGQTLSADISYNHFNRESNEYISNRFTKPSGEVYRPELLQQNLSPSKIKIWAAKADYAKPLSKKTSLEAGVKYSWVKSDNDLIFGPMRNGVYTIDPNFSSNFIYTENINAAYASFSTSTEKWKINGGLRVEQTIANGNSADNKISFKKNYLSYFPQVQLRYNHNAKNNFTLSFNRAIQRPNYEDINPFLYYVDLYDYRSGNPQLLPSYTSKIELSHTYNSSIVTSLYATVTDNFYGFNAYEQNNQNKVNITTRKNFGRMAAYGIRFYSPAQFTSWWNATFTADVSYQRITAYEINGDLDKGTQDVILSTMQSFTLGGGFSAEIAGKYESPTFYGVSQFKANYRLDAGISKSVFDGMGTFRLTMIDIFRTERDRAYTNYGNLNLSIVNREEGRLVRFGFSYRFGNKQLKSARAHRVSNEDEQRRTGNVAGAGTNAN